MENHGNPYIPFFIGLIMFIFARPLLLLSLKTSSMYPEWMRKEKGIKTLVMLWRVLASIYMLVALYGILLDLGFIH